MAIEIRTPHVEDADAMGRVHVSAWQAAYSGGLMPDDYLDSLSETQRASMWRSNLQNEPRPRSARFVASVDGQVVGFVVVGPANGDQESEIGELYAINVDPFHWGAGVGAALIGAAVSALRADGYPSAVLWVHPDNERALSFYTSRGWISDAIARQQQVLGVEVPEIRLSLVMA